MSNTLLLEKYQVKEGDTLWDIAEANNVTVNDLVKWNHISNPNFIKTGQTLYISRDNASPTTKPPTSEPMNFAPKIDPLPTAPTYDSTRWEDTVKGYNASTDYENAKDAVSQHGDFQYGNQTQLDAIMNSILNREKFSYDFNQDAFYQMYKDMFTKQGKQAMADVMGQAATMTGGYGNSYAATAGNQAYQASLDKLNAVIPELYQMAYDQYNQEGQDLYNKLGMLQSDYDRAYGEHTDQYKKLMDILGIAKSDYYDGADMFYDEQNNRNTLANQSFNDAMAIWNANNTNEWKEAEWARDQAWRDEDILYRDGRDKIEDERYEEQYSKTSTGGTGGSGSGSGNGGNGGSSGGNGGGNKATGKVTDAMRKKAGEFKNNDALADWAYGLADSGAIGDDEADALIAEFMDPYEEVNDEKTGEKRKKTYKEMSASTDGWEVTYNGGANFVGVDRNARVRTPAGEEITLGNLKQKLIDEGMSSDQAEKTVKALQQDLGISTNWFFGL